MEANAQVLSGIFERGPLSVFLELFCHKRRNNVINGTKIDII